MTEEVREMLSRHNKARPWRGAAYLLLVLGGIIIWIDPTKSVQQIPFAVRWVWTGLILAGSLVSLVGTIKDWWICEFGGLPVTVAGFAGLVFVLSIGGTTGTLAFGCWIGSIVVVLARRWLDLWKFVKATGRAEGRF